jgi:shikimate kinase
MSKSKNFFLIGPMGAGKTSVGRLLAKLLGLEFYDSDQVIEQQTGANIPWIFDIEGEAGFRKREAKAIAELTQEEGIVLATGGGVVLNPANRVCLSQRGTVIYLNVSIEEQVQRTGRSRNRPLILLKHSKKDVLETLKKDRDSLYQEIADYIIDTNDGSVRAIVHAIMQKIVESSAQDP